MKNIDLNKRIVLKNENEVNMKAKSLLKVPFK
jgi:hypothetical protein